MRKIIISAFILLILISSVMAVVEIPNGLKIAVDKVINEKAKSILQENIERIAEKLNITDTHKIKFTEFISGNIEGKINKKAKLFRLIPITITDKMFFNVTANTLIEKKSWLWIISKELKE